MSANEVEWLSPEIIQDLLMMGMEESDTTAGAGTSVTSNNQEQRGGIDAITAVTDEELARLLDGMGATGINFSPHGKFFVKQWIQDFNKTKNKGNLIANQARHCLTAAQFFQSTIDISDPAFLLLKV